MSVIRLSVHKCNHRVRINVHTKSKFCDGLLLSLASFAFAVMLVLLRNARIADAEMQGPMQLCRRQGLPHWEVSSLRGNMGFYYGLREGVSRSCKISSSLYRCCCNAINHDGNGHIRTDSRLLVVIVVTLRAQGLQQTLHECNKGGCACPIRTYALM